MSDQSLSDVTCFSSAQKDALARAGWSIVRLPAELTLSNLRAGGAPFKGTRYFDSQARDTKELTTVATDVAYRPALLPGAFNLTFLDASRRLADLHASLPEHATALVAPAAAYVWLLQRCVETTRRYPFSQLYTWSADRYQERTNLVVGVFGQQRPIIVAPITEGRGAGVGIWPIVVPEAVAAHKWPAIGDKNG